MSDSGEFVCETSLGRHISFVHEIAVIAVPSVKIQVKFRYVADKCDDQTSDNFGKKIREMINQQVCSNQECAVGDIDIWCESPQQEGNTFRFTVDVVINVKKSPTSKCDQVCTKKELTHQSENILSILEHDILKSGSVTLETSGFQYTPKAIVSLQRTYTCGVGMEISKEFCVPCKPGTYYSNQRCELCELDTFSSQYGVAQCTSCPEGMETSNLGETSVDECKDGKTWILILAAVAILIIFCLLLWLCYVIKSRWFKDLEQLDLELPFVESEGVSASNPILSEVSDLNMTSTDVPEGSGTPEFEPTPSPSIPFPPVEPQIAYQVKTSLLSQEHSNLETLASPLTRYIPPDLTISTPPTILKALLPILSMKQKKAEKMMTQYQRVKKPNDSVPTLKQTAGGDFHSPKNEGNPSLHVPSETNTPEKLASDSSRMLSSGFSPSEHFYQPLRDSLVPNDQFYKTPSPPPAPRGIRPPTPYIPGGFPSAYRSYNQDKTQQFLSKSQSIHKPIVLATPPDREGESKLNWTARSVSPHPPPAPNIVYPSMLRQSNLSISSHQQSDLKPSVSCNLPVSSNIDNSRYHLHRRQKLSQSPIEPGKKSVEGNPLTYKSHSYDVSSVVNNPRLPFNVSESPASIRTGVSSPNTAASLNSAITLAAHSGR